MVDDKRLEKDLIKPSGIIFKKEIFSDQPRFSIMFLLFLNKKVDFVELQHVLKLTPGNLDHHIRKLEKADYVVIRKKFSWRPLNVVIITNSGAEAFHNYVSNLKQVLRNIE